MGDDDVVIGASVWQEAGIVRALRSPANSE